MVGGFIRSSSANPKSSNGIWQKKIHWIPYHENPGEGNPPIWKPDFRLTPLRLTKINLAFTSLKVWWWKSFPRDEPKLSTKKRQQIKSTERVTYLKGFNSDIVLKRLPGWSWRDISGSQCKLFSPQLDHMVTEMDAICFQVWCKDCTTGETSERRTSRLGMPCNLSFGLAVFELIDVIQPANRHIKNYTSIDPKQLRQYQWENRRSLFPTLIGKRVWTTTHLWAQCESLPTRFCIWNPICSVKIDNGIRICSTLDNQEARRL